MATSISLYDMTVPVMLDAMSALDNILSIAEKQSPDADTKFVSAKLADDMLPLSFQVAVATDVVHKFTWRAFPDNKAAQEGFDWKETNFKGMHERIRKTVELARGIKREELNKLAEKSVTIGVGKGQNMTLSLLQMYQGYTQPNLFFHVTTTYAILRSLGVPLGKNDYLHAFLKPPTA